MSEPKNLGRDFVTSGTLSKLFFMAVKREESFLTEFQKHYRNFSARLSETTEKLSDEEKLLCALIKSGLCKNTIVEVGYKKNSKAFYNSMYKIGQKLNKPGGQHLRTYLAEL